MKANWIGRTVATNLKHYRSELAFSQKDLAAKSELSYRLVQELESGEGNPTLSTLLELAALFKVTINTLLELRFIRLSDSDDTFIDRFKLEFKTARIAAALRTLDGVVIWGNDKFSKVYGLKQSFEKGPVDIMSLLPSESRGVFKQQLATERNGYALPYTLAHDWGKDGRIFLRSYPTLILPHKGRMAAFTSIYSTEMSEDCTLNYYEYCKHLFSAAYPE